MVIVKQPAGRIKYRGVMDFDAVYKHIFHWLEDRQYIAHEESFKYKPPHEFEVKIHGDRKITGYVKYNIHVEFFSQHFNEVEVEKNGKKKKMISGNMRISFSGDVETDYETEDGHRLWESSPFYERLKHFFENYIYKWRFQTQHPDTIYYEVVGLVEEVKKMMEQQGRVESFERVPLGEGRQNNG